MKKTSCFLLLGVLCCVFGPLRTVCAVEGRFPVQPGTDRLLFQQTAGELYLLTSRPISIALTTSIPRTNAFPQTVIDRYVIRSDEKQIQTDNHEALRTRWSTCWALAYPDQGEPALVATDIEGSNPLEPPNNPLARLWLLPATFDTPTPLPITMTPAAAMEEHAQFTKQGVSSRARVNGKFSFAKIDDLAVVPAGDAAWSCIGLSAGNEEAGVWVKPFTLLPMAWQRDGSVIKGPFVQMAAAPWKDGLLLATVDAASAVDIFQTPTRSSLDKAQRVNVVPSTTQWKHGEYLRKVLLATHGTFATLGLVVERVQPTKGVSGPTAVKRELRFYSYNFQDAKWEYALITVPLPGPIVDIALARDRTSFTYAYIYEEPDGLVGKIEQIPAP